MSKYSSCLFFFLLPIFGLETVKVLTDAGINYCPVLPAGNYSTLSPSVFARLLRAA